MSLSELIEILSSLQITCNNTLSSLDGKGSPFSSEKQIKCRILEEYRERAKPLKDELDRREKVYLAWQT